MPAPQFITSSQKGLLSVSILRKCPFCSHTFLAQQLLGLPGSLSFWELAGPGEMSNDYADSDGATDSPKRRGEDSLSLIKVSLFLLCRKPFKMLTHEGFL